MARLLRVRNLPRGVARINTVLETASGKGLKIRQEMS
jgi:ribosomal protein L29